MKIHQRNAVLTFHFAFVVYYHARIIFEMNKQPVLSSKSFRLSYYHRRVHWKIKHCFVTTKSTWTCIRNYVSSGRSCCPDVVKTLKTNNEENRLHFDKVWRKALSYLLLSSGHVLFKRRIFDIQLMNFNLYLSVSYQLGWCFRQICCLSRFCELCIVKMEGLATQIWVATHYFWTPDWEVWRTDESVKKAVRTHVQTSVCMQLRHCPIDKLTTDWTAARDAGATVGQGGGRQ